MKRTHLLILGILIVGACVYAVARAPEPVSAPDPITPTATTTDQRGDFDLDATNLTELFYPIDVVTSSAELSRDKQYLVFKAKKDDHTLVYVYHIATESLRPISGIKGENIVVGWLSNGLLQIFSEEVTDCEGSACTRYSYVSDSTERPWMMTETVRTN